MKTATKLASRQRTKANVTLETLRDLRKRVSRAWKGQVSAVQEVRRQRMKPYDR